jgi:predicted GNAT family N-acyltransferase
VCFTIKQPQTEEQFKHYYHLRWQQLRAPWNQPEGSEVDTIEDRCLHVMALDNNSKVIGVARLQFNSNNEAQIRYMAIDNSFQRQGIGRELVKTLEQYAKKTAHKNIVLDARETAVAFYKKIGYKVIKKSYLLFDEIQHFRMTKILND